MVNQSIKTFEINVESRQKTIKYKPGQEILVLNKLPSLISAYFQSSTMGGCPCRANGQSDRAVDGKTSGNFWDDTCTHTKYKTGNWWQVTLAKVYKIDAVTIFNRRDCCGDRIVRAQIWVGKDGKFEECATVTKTIAVSEKFSCKKGLEGNVVKITQDKNVLTLCEVQVFGQEPDEDDKKEDEEKKDKEERKKERRKKRRKERKKKEKDTR